MECRTLLGEPEWVHVQNMEQLHDCYQNVTEHKPQATVYEKIYRQHRTWVRLGSPAGAFMTCDSPHWCHHWRGRSMWWVTPTLSGNANNGIDRWNLFVCGTPCHSSHWIGLGRCMSCLHPCYCHRGGTSRWVVVNIIGASLSKPHNHSATSNSSLIIPTLELAAGREGAKYSTVWWGFRFSWKGAMFPGKIAWEFQISGGAKFPVTLETLFLVTLSSMPSAREL